ncbi:MAG: ABC transporter permease [Candidatus Moranbacteria bacterium]|nr:ABC transporter permease [Candidatus Moranbacteria bacterium]
MNFKRIKINSYVRINILYARLCRIDLAFTNRIRQRINLPIDICYVYNIKVAKAKGLKGNKVIFKHALRNGMIPVITTAGIQLGYLIGGTIVVESMFAIPGMGRLLLQAVNQRDYPVVQGLVAFIGILIVVLNILIDILYSVIDPRIELSD